MTLTVAPPPTEAPDAGVIEEARTRQRRPRRRAAAVVAGLAALAAALLAVWGSHHASSTRRSLTFTARGPTVDARAFAREGDLAFVSRGALWVLDGSGRLRKLTVSRGLTPISPAFSPDGRWLAYVGAAGGGGGIWNSTPEVWIAHANGSDPREVGGLRNPVVIGWSPRADQLAVTEQGVVRAQGGVVLGRQTSLWLLTPSGERRELMSADSIDGGAWSPDGSRLAVATDTSSLWGNPHPTAALVVYTVASRRAVTWLRLPLAAPSAAERGADLVLPVGWWPRWGIGFWLDSADGNDPSVRDGGGLQLFHLDGPGQAPARLGDTLSDGAVSPIVASATGELAITDEPRNGGAEPLWQNQEVERCSPASGACVWVPAPRGDVSLDPAWAANGSKLAYLVGRNFGSAGGAGFTQSVVARWYDSLQLWLYDPTSRRSVLAPAAQGAVVPVWSNSGDSLLFVADDGLWLWKHTAGEPVEVAGPLLSLHDWNAFFAQIDWSDRFAWSR